MKKTILYILIGAILSGSVLAPAGAAFAQTPGAGTKLTPQQMRTEAIRRSVETEGANSVDVASEYDNNPSYAEQLQQSYLTPAERGDTTASPTPASPASGSKNDKVVETNCLGSGVVGGLWAALSGKALECTAAWVASFAMWISARTLWIAGVLLDITLEKTLNLSGLLENFTLVTLGWQVLRDVANIIFIFIALWTGISITLGIKPGEAYGYLAQMVLVALFINFSLFITQVVVDASNIAALHFYQRIVAPEDAGKLDGGLSSAFMNALQLQTLYNTKAVEGSGGNAGGASNYLASVGQAGNATLSFTNIMLIGVFGSVFMIVAAFVFFAAAILFLIRAITLMMLMILSPLAFVGLLLPGASGMAHEWWHKLWSQAFFAPLYMALAYVVVRAINDPSFQTFLIKSANADLPSKGGTTFAAAFTGFGPDSINIIFAFILLIGLMVGCLLVAQSLGAKGSETVMAMGNKLKGEATGFVGRSAMRGFGLGSLGEKLQERNAAKKAKGGSVGLVSRFGAAALKYSSMRNLNERLGQTKIGNYGIGKFIREQTTGRMAEAKFGGSKSAEEAYEESEHDASVRRAIGLISQARQGATTLQPLRHRQNLLNAARFAAQGNVARTTTALAAAQTAPPPTPQQQARITAAEQALAAAQQNLAQFQALPPTAQTPAVQLQLQQNVTTAEQALAAAQAPQFTPHQQAVTAAEQVYNQAQQNLAANPADPALIQARDNAQQALKLLSPEFKALLEAQQNLVQAELDIKKDESKHGSEIAAAIRKISESFAKLSTKEFIDYTPKNDFFNPELMDFELLGTDKYNALIKDEHALTEEEKTEVTHARMHRLIEEAKRGEERTKWFHNAMQIYQKQINPLLKQLRAEEAKPQDLQDHALVQSLKQKIGKIEQPQQPGWDTRGLRIALRNMRGTEEVGNWYRYGDKKDIKLDQLVQTVMQGIWSDVRKSDLFDSGFKDDIRVIKRKYVLNSADMTTGFNPNVTKELEKYERAAMDELRKDANKRLTEVGPDQYFREFDQTFGVRYQDLITRYGSSGHGDVSDSMGIDERREVLHEAGMTMYDQVSQNLASDEFTMMPGLLRDLHVVMRNLEVSQLRHYAERDLDIKIPMVEFLINEYKNDITGVRPMSKKNAQIFTWFVNQNGGDFIPFEQIKPELRDYYEQIKSLIGRKDARSQPSIYERVREYEHHENDAPVMQRINQIRTGLGLPPLAFENTPLARHGAVA